jgi:lysophospholipase L1-like esterase
MRHDGARRSSRLSTTAAVALGVASLVVVAGAGSSPVAAKGVRRAKKPAPLAAPSALPASVTPVASVAPIASVSSSAPAIEAAASSSATVPAPAPSAPVAPSKLVIGAGTRVLVFGDSFTDAGFSQRMRKLVEERGGRFFGDGWTSATTKSWATKDRLPNLLFLAKPDVVIVVLGANEVFLGAPEKMAPYVKSIVSTFSSKQCAWVSPALWKGETGIVAVTRANSSPCGFFDSGALKLDKQADGIHPTLKGGATWADTFWSTMVAP